MNNKKIVIGVTGASCIALAIDVLGQFKLFPEWEAHLVFTKGAELTLRHETNISLDTFTSLADYFYFNDNIGDNIASGTFKTNGMIVVPCSMKTVSGIYSGYSDNLLLRAADVTLKERRPLVIVVRETPLSQLHLRNLYELSKLGAIIMPPMITLYQNPKSADDIIRHITGKILDVFSLEVEGFKRWGSEL